MFAFITPPPNSTVLKYPVDIRKTFPHTSWPEDLSTLTTDKLPKNYVRVYDAPLPEDPYVKVIGEQITFRNGEWMRIWITKRWLVAEVVSDLKDKAAKKRQAVEQQGYYFPTKLKHFDSSVESQNRISNILTNAAASGMETFNFKAIDGWVSMTFADIEKLANGIAYFVQACFNNEYKHSTEIDLIAKKPMAYENLVKYDVNTGWPA